MKKILQFISLSLVLIITGCTKVENGPDEKWEFTGITSTNIFGQILINDSTDWNLNDIWEEKEAALFGQSYSLNCSTSSNFGIIAYPNPVNNVFTVSATMPSTAMLDVRLVNNRLNTLASFDSLKAGGSNRLNLSFDAASLNTKGVVRLYYRFIEDSCEYRGHGDILIQ